MKTINMLFESIQHIICVINDITHGCGQAAKMFDDAMVTAREQQLTELAKD